MLSPGRGQTPDLGGSICIPASSVSLAPGEAAYTVAVTVTLQGTVPAGAVQVIPLAFSPPASVVSAPTSLSIAEGQSSGTVIVQLSSSATGTLAVDATTGNYVVASTPYSVSAP